MFSYIKGTLEETHTDHVVIDHQGIGCRIFMPDRCIPMLGARGEEVKVYTYLHVREDAMLLFGFASGEELALFRQLIGVSGIGPKGGLALLSVMSADDLRFAVLAGDDKKIAKAPGIGKKTAQRLIIELKDRIGTGGDTFAGSADVPAPQEGFPAREEAVQALEALGYSRTDAYAVVSKLAVTEESDTEDILKQALKQLAFL